MLEVPGASLHYEVQGSGPVLLVIPGMPADAGFYAVLTRRLAASFTVVAFDPRGMSRSRLDGPPSDQLVPVHADDARRVLAWSGPDPPTCSATASPGWSASSWPPPRPGRSGP
jgi:pimeloyl-ACP methyl ester carboxylesterase